MIEPILQVRRLAKRFGGLAAVDEISMLGNCMRSSDLMAPVKPH
jgi:ABC-type branched-subunit amino acid transport system ATPase component